MPGGRPTKGPVEGVILRRSGELAADRSACDCPRSREVLLAMALPEWGLAAAMEGDCR